MGNQQSADESPRQCLLRWRPPDAGTSETLTIIEEMRGTTRFAPCKGRWSWLSDFLFGRTRDTLDHASQANTRYVNQIERCYRVASGNLARPGDAFALDLLPLAFAAHSQSDTGEAIIVRGTVSDDRTVDVVIDGSVPEAEPAFQRLCRSVLQSPIRIELTPRGVVLSSTGGSAPQDIVRHKNQVDQIFQGLQWVAGKDDPATVIANNTFLQFPEASIAEGTSWSFSREATSFGVRMNADCEGKLVALDGAGNGTVARISETALYEMDGDALGRGVAASVEAAERGLRARPLAINVTSPPSTSQWVFDAASGRLISHTSLMEMIVSLRIDLEGPYGRGTFLMDISMTSRTQVSWQRDPVRPLTSELPDQCETPSRIGRSWA